MLHRQNGREVVAEPRRTEMTRLLFDWNDGDQCALDHLVPMVMEDLRTLASRQMASERVDHTLQPTALVNEVYIQLVGERPLNLKNRAQFFAAIAQRMRHILIDRARERGARKRGGGLVVLPLEEVGDDGVARPLNIDSVLLSQLLLRLEEQDPRLCKVVEMRVFAGFTIEEVAELLQIGKRTVQRDWEYARALLHEELKEKG